MPVLRERHLHEVRAHSPSGKTRCPQLPGSRSPSLCDFRKAPVGGLNFLLFYRLVAHMKFRCNIGWGGRILRIVVGLVLIADAYLLYRFKMPDDQWWSLALQIVLAAFGAFTVFEGAVGWCAVRALGIRTRF